MGAQSHHHSWKMANWIIINLGATVHWSSRRWSVPHSSGNLTNNARCPLGNTLPVCGLAAWSNGWLLESPAEVPWSPGPLGLSSHCALSNAPLRSLLLSTSSSNESYSLEANSLTQLPKYQSICFCGFVFCHSFHWLFDFLCEFVLNT